MYILNGKYLGRYSNNVDIAPINADEDYGIDAYEPEFFLPVESWLENGPYEVALKYDIADFEGKNDYTTKETIYVYI